MRPNLLLLAALVCAAPAFASSREELKQTQEDIALSQKRQEELAAQHEALQGELALLQKRLVEAAAAVQKGEAALSDAEQKLGILTRQLTAKSKEMEGEKKRLQSLVQAALRLSYTPPEALIMLPGDLPRTIKAARALKMASDRIRQETQSLALQMAELDALKKKVATHRDTLALKQSALDAGRKTLEKQLKERRAMQKKLGLAQRQEAEKLAKLAKKAQDLQELVSSLGSLWGRSADEGDRRGSAKGQLRSFAAARGHMHSPVAGQLAQRFGAGKGRASKGISIAARPGARVTAPYDGEVVFAGPFMGYGKLVILRHRDDFHTLLAGLDDIDAQAGQFLLEGEPIGAMGEGESENRLYVELRKNNQPVDPVPWIGGLTGKR